MNTIAITHPAAPKPLLPVGVRIAAAAAVVALVSAAWLYAGQASRYAVDSAQAVLTPGVMYVTLPRVEIVGHRDSTDRMASAAQSLSAH